MLKSMTAYGRANTKTAVGLIVVDIQSVNRKHLEINVLLPKELELFDCEIKKWLMPFISRGSVSVKISASFENKVPFTIRPNLPLALQIKEAWDQIASHLHIDNGSEFDLSLLAGVEDILIIEENRENEGIYREALKHAVELALKGFMQMKTHEGAILQADIADRILKIHQLMKKIEERTPHAPQKYRAKLMERLEEIMPGHIENEERILREVAVFAEKIDVTEEVIRFFCHLSRFEEFMQSETSSVGKTLEFILQELNREVNTIGSKSADLDISHFVIDIKSELERIREQIQNIE